MIPIYADQVDQLLRRIALGFAETPRQLLIFFVSLAGLLLLVVLGYLLQHLGARRTLLAHARGVYERLVRQFSLSRSERQLLDRLSLYCRSPEKRYLVMLDQHMFESCASRLLEKEEVPEVTLVALRLKLELAGRASGEEVPSSSSELPRGTRVILVVRGSPNINARVSRQDPEAMVVVPDQERQLPPLGTPVKVYFANRSGMYAFASHVRKLTAEAVHLDHSETIRRLQRRRHYRKEVRVPVEIMRHGTTEMPLSSTILDLSGSGARVNNPEGSLQRGDRLVISFFFDNERFTLPATVVQLSKSARAAHLRFDSLSESRRDRIIRGLFAPGPSA
jgi:predicted signal transduction protein with EAL and GGDEF domain